MVSISWFSCSDLIGEYKKFLCNILFFSLKTIEILHFKRNSFWNILILSIVWKQKNWHTYLSKNNVSNIIFQFFKKSEKTEKGCEEKEN